MRVIFNAGQVGEARSDAFAGPVNRQRRWGGVRLVGLGSVCFAVLLMASTASAAIPADDKLEPTPVITLVDPASEPVALPSDELAAALTDAVGLSDANRSKRSQVLMDLASSDLVGADSTQAQVQTAALLVLDSAANNNALGFRADLTKFEAVIDDDGILADRKQDGLGPDQPVIPSETGYVDLAQPSGSEHGDMKGGNCPARWNSDRMGRVTACWFKYRMHDEEPKRGPDSRDFWVYLQATYAEPADLRFMEDPFVAQIMSWSQMRLQDRVTRDHWGPRDKNFFIRMLDHSPKTDWDKDCRSIPIVGVRGSVEIGYDLTACAQWDQRVDHINGAKSVRYDGGWLAHWKNGEDREAGHAVVLRTYQRRPGFTPIWDDTQWAEFCTQSSSPPIPSRTCTRIRV